MIETLLKFIGSLLAGSLLLVFVARFVGAVLPDEGQIAFASARDGDLDIYLLDVARGATVNLTNTTNDVYQPAWSPDGMQMAYVMGGGDRRNIYVRQVGCTSIFSGCGANPYPLTIEAGDDYTPAWSPDGNRLVYVSTRYGNPELFILAVNGDSGHAHRLTEFEGRDNDPSWSPDGQQIVFTSDREDRWNADLYLMDADGSDILLLLGVPDNQLLPVWSPDGRHILFTTSNAQRRQLAMIEVDRPRNPIFLLDNLGSDDAPDWSPDGDAIVMMSYRDQQADVYVYRLDCTGTPDQCLRRLTHDSFLDLNPRWRP